MKIIINFFGKNPCLKNYKVVSFNFIKVLIAKFEKFANANKIICR